jgi:hypothetical protein
MLARAAEQYGNGGRFVDFRYRVDSAAGAPEIDIVFRDDAWHETASVE